MKLIKIEITLSMLNYIAHPYWPEREAIISIQKDSGMSRQKSDEKRALALATQLKKVGMTKEEYEALVIRANRQWYREDSDDNNTPIIIPRHHIAGACVQTIGVSPKALRGSYDKDNFRSQVHISDFTTTKTKADGTFSRYVKRDGQVMRTLTENEFLGIGPDSTAENFQATGTLRMFDTEKPDVLQRLFEHAITITGTGACRKMGYGRGEVTKWEIK